MPVVNATQPENRSAEIPTVEVRTDGKDFVAVTMFETIDPCPTIGSWNGVHELGVRTMDKNKSYRVPRHVADVLVDAKKATTIEIQ